LLTPLLGVTGSLLAVSGFLTKMAAVACQDGNLPFDHLAACKSDIMSTESQAPTRSWEALCDELSEVGVCGSDFSDDRELDLIMDPDLAMQDGEPLLPPLPQACLYETEGKVGGSLDKWDVVDEHVIASFETEQAQFEADLMGDWQQEPAEQRRPAEPVVLHRLGHVKTEAKENSTITHPAAAAVPVPPAVGTKGELASTAAWPPHPEGGMDSTSCVNLAAKELGSCEVLVGAAGLSLRRRTRSVGAHQTQRAPARRACSCKPAKQALARAPLPAAPGPKAQQPCAPQTGILVPVPPAQPPGTGSRRKRLGIAATSRSTRV